AWRAAGPSVSLRPGTQSVVCAGTSNAGLAKAADQVRVGKAGLGKARLGLPGADGPPRLVPDETVDTADVVSHSLETLLHPAHVAAVEPSDLAPWGDERPVGREPVGQVAYVQGVEVGLVVALEHVEVGGRDEGGAVSPGRHQKEALAGKLRLGPRPAGNTGDAEAGPFADRLAAIRPFQGARDRGRHIHLEAPVAAGLPAV